MPFSVRISLRCVGRVFALAAVLLGTFVPRVLGISQHFWMKTDQIRDWSIALGPFWKLPLVGPPTHVGSYTVGPAFYWILWAIRVVVGPWFLDLPHGGGVGQALLDSAADALLFAAIWKRTGSAWTALATIVLVATAAYDLCLAAVIWNPMVGTILAKVATALVLLDWGATPYRAATTAAVAWAAVQAYTGAAFVMIGVLTALVLRASRDGGWKAAMSRVLLIVAMIAALQIPYLIHRWSLGVSDSAMGSVIASIDQIRSGAARPTWGKSATYYGRAVRFIEASPWDVAGALELLGAGALIVAWRFRRDPELLAVTLLPQVAAVTGYAFWVGGLDFYYYFSLMPAAVLALVLGVTSALPRRLATIGGAALVIGALALVPARLRMAATLHRMPEYRMLVAGSREILRWHRPIRAIRTDFPMPTNSDEQFVYVALGGTFDHASPWVAFIDATGHVSYRR